MSRIIVAGAGHGGLAAAAQLAKKGFEVTVYERGEQGKLGYDWTDIFAPGAFAAAGIPMPDEDKYEFKENMTFFSPDKKHPLKQDVAPDKLEIKMERRDIYEHLINYALGCGVKIVYGCSIEAPEMAGNRVVGIKTSLGSFYADLVIDAAGLNSPLRKKLPPMCGIMNDVKRFEKFYVYRAFYNRLPTDEKQDKYKVYFFPDGKLGIGWVATEGEFTDVLIGKFDELNDDGINEALTSLHEHNPQLGSDLLRGGQRVQIPVRQPLSVFVCDGYAAIGDSAFMTVPVIGSGIANCLKASKMLADTIAADKARAFSAETLWGYQVKYYKALGSGFAALAVVKLLLTKLTPGQLDYIFDKSILTAQDLTIDADSTSLASMIKFDVADMISRAKNICNDTDLLKKILAVGAKLAAVSATCAAMPRTWNRRAVFGWAKKYDSLF